MTATLLNLLDLKSRGIVTTKRLINNDEWHRLRLIYPEFNFPRIDTNVVLDMPAHLVAYVLDRTTSES